MVYKDSLDEKNDIFTLANFYIFSLALTTIKLLELINKLFSIEDTCRTYTPEARLSTKQERSAPIVDEFFSICHKYLS